MGIVDKLAGLFSSGVDKVIDSVGDAIDKNVTSDEERLQKKNELQKLKNELSLEFEKMSVNLEKEYTQRLALDMKSDNKLSKMVRPGSLIYLLLVVTVLALTDGNIVYGDYTFQIKKEYIDLFQILLVSVFTFYFGSRGAEKIMKIWKGQ